MIEYRSIVVQDTQITLSAFTGLVKKVFGRCIDVVCTINGLTFNFDSDFVRFPYDHAVNHINSHHAAKTFKLCMYLREFSGNSIHESEKNEMVIDFNDPPESVVLSGFRVNEYEDCHYHEAIAL